jgi:aspartate aminotransferase-like enzyme
MVNPLAELIAVSKGVGAELCVDAISAIGLMPVDLQQVRFATAVSGKGLAAFAGLAAVFHDGRLSSAGHIPRYLDLANYEATDSVPFTHSSNLLAALDRSLILTHWPRKFECVRTKSRTLRAALRRHSLPPLAQDTHAAPGIVTLEIPSDISAAAVGLALSEQGIQIAWQSRYLQQRNWVQICLMGELHEPALRRLPGALARQVAILRGQNSMTPTRVRCAPPRRPTAPA